MNLEQRNREMQEFFDAKYDTYEEVHSKMMKNKSVIADELNENTSRILDLGVGTGLELIPVFERFPEAEITGIDISSNMLNILKEKSFKDRVHIVCGDFFLVDFGDGYDAVISSAALHHFDPKDKVILYGKIYDALKTGGQFINSDRVVDTLEEERNLMNQYLKNPQTYPHQDTPLSIETEKELLSAVGFKNIEIIELEDERYRVLKMEK